MTGALARAARGRSRRLDRARFLLCRLRRQVRRRGARDAHPLRHPRDERAVGRDGHRLPGRSAAARLRLAGHAGDRDGQLRRRRPLRRPSVERNRLLFGARHVRRSRRRGQYRHRRSHVLAGRSPSTRASMRSGMSATPRRGKVEALSAGNLKATWTSGRRHSTGPRRKAAIPAPRDAGQEHLDPLRGMRGRLLGRRRRHVSRRFKLDRPGGRRHGGCAAIGFACVEALCRSRRPSVYLTTGIPAAAKDALASLDGEGLSSGLPRDGRDGFCRGRRRRGPACSAESGRVDILVCNAGIARSKKLRRRSH